MYGLKRFNIENDIFAFSYLELMKIISSSKQVSKRKIKSLNIIKNK